MGRDSGLATFRGQGSVGGWPGFSEAGLTYEQICNARWFKDNPRLAWAFWHYCYQSYRNTQPHRGYPIVMQWSQFAPLGTFSFTSNIDGHWRRAGWDPSRLVEVHGVCDILQCSVPCCQDVWDAPADLNMKPYDPKAGATSLGDPLDDLPKCPRCGAVARPCVMMFGEDESFSRQRLRVQGQFYEEWLRKMDGRSNVEYLHIVCLEIGCGVSVDTVRTQLQTMLNFFPSARLVRINPEYPEVPPGFEDRSVGLAMDALPALEEMDARMRQIARSPAGRSGLYLLRDHDGVCHQVRAPVCCTVLRLLHLLEGRGVHVTYGKVHEPRDPPNEPYAACDVLNDTPAVDSLAACPPKRSILDINIDHEYGNIVAVLKVANVWFRSNPSPDVEVSVYWCKALIADMTAELTKLINEQQAKPKKRRPPMNETLHTVHEKVLPRFGLKPDSNGYKVMQVKLFAYGCCDVEVSQRTKAWRKMCELRAKGHQATDVESMVAAENDDPQKLVDQSSSRMHIRMLGRQLAPSERRRQALVRASETKGLLRGPSSDALQERKRPRTGGFDPKAGSKAAPDETHPSTDPVPPTSPPGGDRGACSSAKELIGDDMSEEVGDDEAQVYSNARNAGGTPPDGFPKGTEGVQEPLADSLYLPAVAEGVKDVGFKQRPEGVEWPGINVKATANMELADMEGRIIHKADASPSSHGSLGSGCEHTAGRHVARSDHYLEVDVANEAASVSAGVSMQRPSYASSSNDGDDDEDSENQSETVAWLPRRSARIADRAKRQTELVAPSDIPNGRAGVCSARGHNAFR